MEVQYLSTRTSKQFEKIYRERREKFKMLHQYNYTPPPINNYYNNNNHQQQYLNHPPPMIITPDHQSMMMSYVPYDHPCLQPRMMMTTSYPTNDDEGHQVTVFQDNRKSYPGELDPRVKFYKWSKAPAPAPFSILNSDGSLREDEAGIGGIIRDWEGKPLVAYSSKSKCCKDIPVYMVELLAIQRGLREALSRGIRYIVVNSDSLLAVDYITGRTICFRSNVAARECIQDIRNLLKKFKLWDCKHVFRETNRAADFLSTFIQDEDHQVDDVVLYPNEFPKKLKEIVHDDASGRLYLRVKSMNVF